MKVIFDQKELKTCLNILLSIGESKVLTDQIKIAVNPETKEVAFTATNGTSTLSLKKQADSGSGIEIFSAGEALYPGRLTFQLLKTYQAEDKVLLEAGTTRNLMTVKSGVYKYATPNVEEFPKIPNEELTSEVKISAEEFLELINTAVPFVSKTVSDSLSRIRFSFGKKKEVMATDKLHLLYLSNSSNSSNTTKEVEFLLPLQAAQELQKILALIPNQDLSLGFVGNHLVVEWGMGRYTVLSQTQPYPKIQNAINLQKRDLTVKFSARDLLTQTLRVNKFIPAQAVDGLVLTINQNNQALVSYQSEMGEVLDTFETTEFTASVEEVSFNLAPFLIIETLMAVGNAVLKLETDETGNSALLFNGPQICGYDSQFMVMPMHPVAEGNK